MCSQQAAKAKPTPLHLRVFLSSPGDVGDERSLARRVVKDELSVDLFLRDKVNLDLVSWDDPAALTPILANLTPQEAVNRGLPKPSECEIVVVILWSRLGTLLPEEYRKQTSEPYLSGTVWEYLDAYNTHLQPDILVYRRTEDFNVKASDPSRLDKLQQYDLVEGFFARFKNSDGSLHGGTRTYATSSEFAELLKNDLRYLLKQKLEALSEQLAATNAAAHEPLWTGSPYPGLRAFMFEEEAIFFGRGRETDTLIAQLRDPDQRFLAVVGASGTGKSSLIRAGLLPRLAEGAIEGSQHWYVLTVTPGAFGDNPFLALAGELIPVLPAVERKPPVEFGTALAKAPQRITDYAAMILTGRPAAAALVLVIDQLEELFTVVTAIHRRAFIDLLTQGQRMKGYCPIFRTVRQV